MKKNMINFTLMLALSFFSLTACTPSTYPVDATAPTQASDNEKEEIKAEVEPDTTETEVSESLNTQEQNTTLTETENQTEEISSTNSVSDETDIYNDILDRVYFLLTNKDAETDLQDGEIGIHETAMLSENPLNDIGYCIKDISGDGIPELLIGSISEKTDSASYGSIIFDVYTYSDNSPLLTFEGWARNAYEYAEDGNFVYHGSGGAIYSYLGDYTISQDGKELICNNFYFTKEKDETFNDIMYLHNTSGDSEDTASEEITEDEFYNAFEQLDSKVKAIELIPFSSLK